MNTATETLSVRTRDSKFRVSRFSGQISDISLMTGDREATGHGIWIDQKTLETGLDAIAEQGGRLRAAIKHPSLIDQLTGADDRVLDFPGYFSNVHIRGNQLVAGKLEFYDSFKAEHPAEFERLMEMAEKTPDLFGVSVEIGGFVSFVSEDGEEYSEPPVGGDIVLKYGGLPAFRITDLPVASFVDQPAANSGLFARFAKIFGGKPDIAGLKRIAESFIAWSESHSADTEPNAAATVTAILTSGGPAVITYGREERQAALQVLNDLGAAAAKEGELVSQPNGEMAVISTLRERIADKARLARALAILAEFPERPADEIVAVLNLQDKDAELDYLRRASATDAATIDQLRADLSAAVAKAAEFDGLLTAANHTIDGWQAKFVALKNSGLEEPVMLGAGAGAIVPGQPDILAQYEALSGKERSAFYRKHKDAIWAAKEAARA